MDSDTYLYPGYASSNAYQQDGYESSLNPDYSLLGHAYNDHEPAPSIFIAQPPLAGQDFGPQMGEMEMDGSMGFFMGQNQSLSGNFLQASSFQLNLSKEPCASQSDCYTGHIQLGSQQAPSIASPFLPSTFRTPNNALVGTSINGNDGAYGEVREIPIHSDISFNGQEGYYSTPPTAAATVDPGSAADVETADVDTGRKLDYKGLTSQQPSGKRQEPEDVVSFHEKKRHYLECLEQYIIFLHRQFQILGVPTPPLRRVKTYQGLNSRSIRTLLVHMEKSNRNLAVQILAEEQRLMEGRLTVQPDADSSSNNPYTV